MEYQILCSTIKTTGIDSLTKSANEGEWIVKQNKSKKKQDQFGKINRFGKLSWNLI